MITDDEIATIKKDNNRLRNAVYKLITISGIDGKPVPFNKVKEAVTLAKQALKSTSKKSYEQN